MQYLLNLGGFLPLFGRLFHRFWGLLFEKIVEIRLFAEIYLK